MTTGTKIIGKYNIDYCGAAYDGKTKYEMVIISEFDESNGKCKEVSRHTYYFLCGKDLITPEFKTEADVEKITQYYRHYEKIKAWKEVRTTTIGRMI